MFRKKGDGDIYQCCCRSSWPWCEFQQSWNLGPRDNNVTSSVQEKVNSHCQHKKLQPSNMQMHKSVEHQILLMCEKIGKGKEEGKGNV